MVLKILQLYCAVESALAYLIAIISFFLNEIIYAFPFFFCKANNIFGYLLHDAKLSTNKHLKRNHS